MASSSTTNTEDIERLYKALGQQLTPMETRIAQKNNADATSTVPSVLLILGGGLLVFIGGYLLVNILKKRALTKSDPFEHMESLLKNAKTPMDSIIDIASAATGNTL